MANLAAGAAAPPAPEKTPQQDSASLLLQTIAALHGAITKLPSLAPSPAVNALFTSLVAACIPPADIDVADLPAAAADMHRSLIALCGEAEGLLEAHYSDLLAAAFDNPLLHLDEFPYYGNYVKLSKLEYDLLAGSVPGIPAAASVAFLGSGPLPLTSLVLASDHMPAASFHNFDRCAEANARAARLARADAGVRGRMNFHTADVGSLAAAEIAAFDVVFLAALVGMDAEEKGNIIEHLGRSMAPGAALVVRSAHGARAFLYPVVDPDVLRRRGGFQVLAVHHPQDEVINSVIVACKPAAVHKNAGDGHGAAVATASPVALFRPCHCCEAEVRRCAAGGPCEIAMAGELHP